MKSYSPEGAENTINPGLVSPSPSRINRPPWVDVAIYIRLSNKGHLAIWSDR